MYLVFDTETTGLPKDYKRPLSDSENWPRLVQLSWLTLDNKGKVLFTKDFIVKPDDFEIPFSAEKIHGISTEKAIKEGKPLTKAMDEFLQDLEETTAIIGHNIEFDNAIVGAEMYRLGLEPEALLKIPTIDTKEESLEYCAIPTTIAGKYKWPNLMEMYEKLFSDKFSDAHNSAFDVLATARAFLELARLGVINPSHINKTDYDSLKEAFTDVVPPLQGFEDSTSHAKKETHDDVVTTETDDIELPEGFDFVHLHVHSAYSVLDGACKVEDMMKKVVADGQTAISITDHGNMFGVKDFYETAVKYNIKPILGCEVYVAKRNDRFLKEKLDAKSYHLVLLAKDHTGYKNLMKISSLAYKEGFYHKPRVDKSLLKQYAEGIMATSACLNGEVARKIQDESMEKAEIAAKEYQAIFGEDFYFELMRHQSGDEKIDSEVYHSQVYVNEKLLELSKKLNIECIATNDVHFVNREDAIAHDTLICVNTNSLVESESRMRYTRQEWLKSKKEMYALFSDMPEVLLNTKKIADKVESYSLETNPVMPNFPIPEEFGTEESFKKIFSEEDLIQEFSEKSYQRLGGYDKVIRIKLEAEYLKKLTLEGAEKYYGKPLDEQVSERIGFELETIKNMGYPGYFLIVQDFIEEAFKMGVVVGIGRGSAAGSVVAYCLGIIGVDPLKYELLFERFLNPDRISMPDIDIDFDEEGREKVMSYVVDKYGEENVAQIITFGKMAPKMAIRDVARVHGMPLQDADRLAKLIPEGPKVSFETALKTNPQLDNEYKKGTEETKKVLGMAMSLEGSIRNVGTHACGVIIGKDNLYNHIPLCYNKDSNLAVSQFEGDGIESVGMLKMDFLGLKTLSIIKDAVENVKYSKGIEIDIDNLPLDDEKTFQLYGIGQTTGLFQFESDGMKKYLKQLKPTSIEDLIAMNALYRPGPMQYIPSFINRKHGKEKVTYDLPLMEEVLKATYGITVYQEQVMILSRKLAGFTRGESDKLRKAMGKKKEEDLKVLYPKFEKGCKKNNIPEKAIKKIWSDWKEFAKYAFNKSHSTCYALTSYQTAYLKANHPSEFMAAVLSRNMGQIDKISFFIDECHRMGIKVLGPDINESYKHFSVNKKGEIRFGLAAVKGVGEAAVGNIIETRKEEGKFESVADFVKKVNLRAVNKKTVESLANAGAFDEFTDGKRSAFFYSEPHEQTTFIDKMIKFGALYQANKNSNQLSLFGEKEEENIPDPALPDVKPWSEAEKLKKEKEVIGFYISGHPLDQYDIELKTFCNAGMKDLQTLKESMLNRMVCFAGIVSSPSKERFTKNNKPYGTFTLEDKETSLQFTLFGDEYVRLKPYIENEDYALFIRGTIRKNWRNKEEIEIGIDSMQLLSELLEKRVRKINISIDLKDLNDEFVSEIINDFKQNKGKTPVQIHVKDKENELDCRLSGSKYKVNSEDFIQKIKKYPKIRFGIE